MDVSLPVCVLCGYSFQAADFTGGGGACPCCGEAAAGGESFRWQRTLENGRIDRHGRFIALSALPEAERLPAGRHGLIVPRRLKTRELGVSTAPESTPVATRSPRPHSNRLPVRQLAFNCPACFTVLVIKDPQHYDGRAAPCPSCRAVILPPRVAPPSPFTLITAPEPAGTSLPAQPKQSRWMRFERRSAVLPACGRDDLERSGAA